MRVVSLRFELVCYQVATKITFLINISAMYLWFKIILEMPKAS